MKKKVALCLAVMLSFGMASNALAADASFTDVPKDNWSYAAVQKLVKDGIVNGYNDQTFRGDQPLSRYEMAVIVAKALQKVDKVDGPTKDLINKLSKEYEKELNDMGIRVTRLEKAIAEATPSLIDWTGTNLSLRSNHMSMVKNGKTQTVSTINGLNLLLPYGVANSPSDLTTYTTELVATSRVSGNWTLQTRIEGSKNLDGESVVHDHLTGTLDLESYTATGSLLDGKVVLGRDEDKIINGLVYDDWMSGIRYETGSKLKATAFFGKVDNASPAYWQGTIKDIPSYINCYGGINLYALKLAYPLGEKTNAYAAYYRTTSYLASYTPANIYETAFDTKIAPLLVLKADYAQSDLSDNNKAYMMGLKYEDADKKVAKSRSLMVDYVHIEAKASIETGYDFRNYQVINSNNTNLANPTTSISTGDITYNPSTNQTTLNGTNGQKGFQITYQYVPAKNILFTVRYLQARPINVDSSVNSYGLIKWISTQLDFFF